MSKDYTKAEVLDIIEREARERSIPRDDFLRFAYIETGGQFNELASRGPHGAKGLFQFVPGTATQYGILGSELDAVANTDAAARLYLDNKRFLIRDHDRDHQPYLSRKSEPDGLDMYMAHQQGAGGYRSIQSALAGNGFSRKDTRDNLLNNISPRDLKALTGSTPAEFAKLSDKDIASTFVEYWQVKFNRIRIPEKAIGPLVTVAQRNVQGKSHDTIELRAAYELTIKNDHVKYGFGSKRIESGAVDCSGWIVELQNKTMSEINKQAGRTVFLNSDRFDPGMDAASVIISKSVERSGVLIKGGSVTKDVLKEGMIIGEDNGAKGWDRGRYKGIDHIVMVLRDPKTHQLVVSQSRGGEGVELKSLDDYLRYKHDRGVALYATDPLAKARPILQEQRQTQSVANSGLHGVATGAAATAAWSNTRVPEAVKDVHALQTLLRKFGYCDGNGNSLETDGILGKHTREAVKAFQQAHGLKIDGIVGPQTEKALKASESSPLVCDPRHKGCDLFIQAYDKLKQIGFTTTFTNEQQFQNAAACLAFEASASGMRRIDHVVLNKTATGLFAVEGQLSDPAHMRVYVDKAQAATQPIEKSTSHIDQDGMLTQNQSIRIEREQKRSLSN